MLLQKLRDSVQNITARFCDTAVFCLQFASQTNYFASLFTLFCASLPFQSFAEGIRYSAKLGSKSELRFSFILENQGGKKRFQEKRYQQLSALSSHVMFSDLSCISLKVTLFIGHTRLQRREKKQ